MAETGSFLNNLKSAAYGGLTKAANWFSPGTPVSPQDAVGTPPYRFDYQRQQNMFGRPRTEIPGLQSFDEIRNVARLYPVNEACISTRIREMQALTLTIKPKDRDLLGYFKRDIDFVNDFWQFPERDSTTFSEWLAKALRDRLEIDALCLHRRPRADGGFYSLEVIDGATIKPILDVYGRVQGYQQYKFGIPSGNFKQPSSVRDPQVPFVGGDELIYKPYNPLSYSPYGLSPVEQSYYLTRTLILKQEFDQAYFTEGDLPLTAITFPPGMFTPEQVEAFAEKFRALLEANLEARNKVQFLPYDAKINELKRFEYNTDLEKYVLQMTCAVHGIPPAELGITDDVNRASSDGQQNLNNRKGIAPLAKSVKGILDFVIQNERYLDMPHLEAVLSGGETEDILATAQTDVEYINAEVFTPQEIKARRSGYLTQD